MDFFDVIWLFDRSIRDQKWKMQVCLCEAEGWFLRINSKDIIRPCVAISKAENGFLDHDSFIDCSLCIIDEYEIQDALSKDGVIGCVTTSVAPDVLACLLAATYIRDADKALLRDLFAPYCPA